LLINDPEISRTVALTRKVLDLTQEQYKRFISQILQAKELSDLPVFSVEILQSTRQAVAEENNNLPQ